MAIFSTSGGYQGIGFAVPVNYAKDIVSQIIKGQQFEYGWVGVGIQALNEQLIEYFGLKSREGVLVNRVVENSPAQKAGLKEGDIILSANDLRIRSATALIRLISSSEIGMPLKLTILRDNKELTIPVFIEKRPSLPSIKQSQRNENPPLLYKLWRGMEVRDIPSDQGAAAGHGIVVQDVTKNGMAYMAGIRNGDIIVAVNKQPVRDIKDFHRIVANLKGDCLIRTLRGHFVIQDQGP